jgi:hypothetical protein
MGRKNLRLDDVLAFVDDGVLIMSALDPSMKEKIISELYKRERKEVGKLLLLASSQEKEKPIIVLRI